MLTNLVIVYTTTKLVFSLNIVLQILHQIRLLLKKLWQFIIWLFYYIFVKIGQVTYDKNMESNMHYLVNVLWNKYSREFWKIEKHFSASLLPSRNMNVHHISSRCNCTIKNLIVYYSAVISVNPSLVQFNDTQQIRLKNLYSMV